MDEQVPKKKYKRSPTALKVDALREEVSELKRLLRTKGVNIMNKNRKIKRLEMELREANKTASSVGRQQYYRRGILIKAKRDGMAKGFELAKAKVEEATKAAEARIERREALRRMDFMGKIDEVIANERKKAVKEARMGILSKLAEKKVRQVMMLKTRSFESVLSYLPLMIYSRQHKMQQADLHLLLLTCVVGTVRTSQLLKYGIPTSWGSTVVLNRLTDEGWLEKFGNLSAAVYTPTLKGKKFFYGFNKFYKKTIEQLTNSDEWKNIASKWAD